MIIKLIDEALIAQQFVEVLETDTTRFYIREMGAAIRFAILHKLNELTTPTELNATITRLIPEEFSNNSSFKKN